MCWRNKDSFSIKLVTEPITVYKVVRIKGEKIYSWFHEDYEYQLNECQHSSISLDWNCLEHFTIDNGFHSYAKKPKVLDYPEELELCGLIVPSEGYQIPYTSRYGGVIECQIPEDAIYVINDSGEIVSNFIIPVRIVPLEELNHEKAIF